MNKKYTIADIKPIKLNKNIYKDVDISRSGFKKNFDDSVDYAINIAKKYISNEIPTSLVYLVYLNCSYDNGRLLDTEHLVYKDTTQLKYALENPSEVVSLLWVDGKVPEWINVSVDSIENGHLIIKLVCCGRFSSNKLDMYLPQSGFSPFSPRSPSLPPWYEEGIKFDLHWKNSV